MSKVGSQTPLNWVKGTVTEKAKQIKSKDDSDGTELDRGYVDYKPIIERCIELNVDDIILEQESFDMYMLESIKISCDYIKSFR